MSSINTNYYYNRLPTVPADAPQQPYSAVVSKSGGDELKEQTIAASLAESNRIRLTPQLRQAAENIRAFHEKGLIFLDSKNGPRDKDGFLLPTDKDGNIVDPQQLWKDFLNQRQTSATGIQI